MDDSRGRCIVKLADEGAAATLTIRLASSLKRELERAAADDDRSVTSYVVRAVREKIARDGEAPRRAVEMRPRVGKVEAKRR